MAKDAEGFDLPDEEVAPEKEEEEDEAEDEEDEEIDEDETVI